jgi:hypothetical protein
MPAVAQPKTGRHVNVKISDDAYTYFDQQAKLRNVMPGALLAKFLELVANEPSYLPNILDDGNKPARVRSTRARGYR